MSKKTLYVTSHGGTGWAVKHAGTNTPSSTHQTQAAAWNEARRLARGVGGEVRLQGSDGTTIARNSYRLSSNATKR